jgi:hypothetical protein
MESRYKRQLKNGNEFNYLFPTASGEYKTIRKYADVNDTLQFIPKVVQSTLHHTKQLAQQLQGNTLDATCRNIWEFVYQHIAYKKDNEGKEQIRSPARAWQDRASGVDCDCYTTFISSILTNLKIPHTYRIAKYWKPYFQHIYPIVPIAIGMNNGKYITIDCVVEKYNYEEPFSEKKDTKMDLQYLNGLDGQEVYTEDALTIDAQDLMGGNDDDMLLGDMGKLPNWMTIPKIRGKPANIFSKVAFVVNRANPATILLRNGVLASMKLNLFKVAQRLKWAYLSDEDAKKKGLIMVRFEKLKAVRAKLEGLFYKAGGNPDNLKKAIMKGKGNRNHEVSGLGDVTEYEAFGELGEPVTATAIASAAGIVGAIAGLIKSIGNIFPDKGKEGAVDFDKVENANGTTSTASEVTIPEARTVPPSITEDGKANPASNVAPATKENTEAALQLPDNENGAGAKVGDQINMWEKNKKWMKPTLIGLGGATILYMGYKAMSGNKPTTPPARKASTSLSGTRRKKRKPVAKKRTIKKQQLFN